MERNLESLLSEDSLDAALNALLEEIDESIKKDEDDDKKEEPKDTETKADDKDDRECENKDDSSDAENKDVYPDDEHEEKKDIDDKDISISEMIMNMSEAEIDALLEELEKGAPESTEDREAKEADVDVDTDDVYGDDDKTTTECDVDGVIEDPATRSLEAKDMEMTNEELEKGAPESTEDREAKEATVDVKTSDVYGDDDETKVECDVDGVIEDPATKPVDADAMVMSEDKKATAVKPLAGVEKMAEITRATTAAKKEARLNVNASQDFSSIIKNINSLTEAEIDALIEELEKGAPESTEDREAKEATVDVKTSDVYGDDDKTTTECDTDGVIEDPATKPVDAEAMAMNEATGRVVRDPETGKMRPFITGKDDPNGENIKTVTGDHKTVVDSVKKELEESCDVSEEDIEPEIKAPHEDPEDFNEKAEDKESDEDVKDKTEDNGEEKSDDSSDSKEEETKDSEDEDKTIEECFANIFKSIRESIEIEADVDTDDVYGDDDQTTEECDTDGVIEDPATRSLEAKDMEMSKEELTEELVEIFEGLSEEECDLVLEALEGDTILEDEVLDESFDIEDYVCFEMLDEGLGNYIRSRASRIGRRFGNAFKRGMAIPRLTSTRRSIATSNKEIIRTADNDINDAYKNYGKEKKAAKLAIKAERNVAKNAIKTAKTPEERAKAAQDYAEKLRATRKFGGTDNATARAAKSRDAKIAAAKEIRDKNLVAKAPDGKIDVATKIAAAKDAAKREKANAKERAARSKEYERQEARNQALRAADSSDHDRVLRFHNLNASQIISLINTVGLAETEDNFYFVSALLEEFEKHILTEEVETEIKADVDTSDVYGDDDQTTEECDTEGVIEDPATKALSAEDMAMANESVIPYSSLKEAFMLEDSYFVTDTYVKMTADTKTDKLVEQVALLMCKESNDPMFAELVKHANAVKNLTEACKKKNLKKATEKVNALKEHKAYEETALLNFLIEALETEGSEEVLTEGFLQNIKNSILFASITFLPEKSLDKILSECSRKINNSNIDKKEKEKLLADFSTKKDKKAKRAFIRTLLKKVPETELANAERKIKNKFKGSKEQIKEAFYLVEAPEYGENHPGFQAAVDNLKAQYSQSTLTNLDVADKVAAAEKAASTAALASASFLGMSGGTLFIVALIIGLILGYVIPKIVKAINKKIDY